MQWDREAMRWVPETSTDALPRSSDGPSRTAKQAHSVAEDTIPRIWEHASRRRMSPEERDRARGHALVAYLGRFPEADLSAAATSARGRSGNLDWREWRRAVERLSEAMESTELQPTPTPPRASKKRAKQGGVTRRQPKGRAGRMQASAPRFTDPDDSREIRTGSWKGRSPRSVSDAELMKRLKKKYPNL